MKGYCKLRNHYLNICNMKGNTCSIQSQIAWPRSDYKHSISWMPGKILTVLLYTETTKTSYNMTESTTKIPLHSKSQIYSFPTHTTLWNPTRRTYFTGILPKAVIKILLCPKIPHSILFYSTVPHTSCFNPKHYKHSILPRMPYNYYSTQIKRASWQSSRTRQCYQNKPHDTLSRNPTQTKLYMVVVGTANRNKVTNNEK